MRDLSWLRRLLGSLRPRAFEREMSAELAAHLALEADALVARGWTAEDARLEARRRFGSVAQTQDLCRDSWGLRAVDTARQDLRHATRALMKDPGCALLIVLTLAIGIGMTTAIFGAVHAIFLQRLPYVNGERLVEIRQQKPGVADLNVSLPELDDYRKRLTSLDAVVEYHQMWFNLIERGAASRVMTGVVSAGFFDVVGIHPSLGRTFVADDDLPDATPVLVVSDSYWRRALGADPRVIGRTVEMNDRVHRIVGVLPPVPQFPEDREPNDVYMPVSACPFHARALAANDRRMRIVSAIGRIRPGLTIADVRRELAAVSGTFEAADPAVHPAGFSAGALSVRDELTARARPTLTVLMGASLCVLLLVCANVANLTLSRLVPREQELRLRAALGASPARLLRQLFIEAASLAAIGGALGLGVAALGRTSLTSYALRFTPRAAEITIDRTVVLFAAGVTILSAMAFGLLPSWRIARTRALMRSRQPSRLLIVPQVAISFVLLAVSLQMTQKLVAMVTADAGFTSHHVLTAQLDLDWIRYSSDDARRSFYRTLLARVGALPGASHAAMSLTFPLNDGGSWRATFATEGDPIDSGDQPQVDFRLASPEYFAALGMTVLRGRGFTDADSTAASSVAVVNRSMAIRRFGGDPVGRRVSIDDGRSWMTITGLVNDVKQYALDSSAVEEIYLPFDRYAPLSAMLVVQTGGDPQQALDGIQDVVRSIDPRQPVSRLRMLDDVRKSSVAPVRMTTTFVAGLAAIALLISAAGIAGAVWCSVNQRNHEIGVRLALGESPARVASRVVYGGLGPVALGIAAGLPCARALEHLGVSEAMQSVGAGPAIVAIFTIAAVATFACVTPARRAASISPIDALRTD